MSQITGLREVSTEKPRASIFRKKLIPPRNSLPLDAEERERLADEFERFIREEVSPEIIERCLRLSRLGIEAYWMLESGYVLFESINNQEKFWEKMAGKIINEEGK